MEALILQVLRLSAYRPLTKSVKFIMFEILKSVVVMFCNDRF